MPLAGPARAKKLPSFGNISVGKTVLATDDTAVHFFSGDKARVTVLP
jgi:hypothetical protein